MSIVSASHVREARPQDAGAIAAVWNPVIRDTLVTFTNEERSPEALAALIETRAAEGLGFFVAETRDGVSGFATYARFRAGPGYARTMEHSIILAPEAQGRGLGRALMARLEDHARARGVHSMFAGVSSANREGLDFHERMGYRRVAVLPEVGFKFGRWLDLHLMQKFL